MTFPCSFPTGADSSRSTGSTSQVGIAWARANVATSWKEVWLPGGQRAKLLQAQMLQPQKWAGEKEELQQVMLLPLAKYSFLGTGLCGLTMGGLSPCVFFLTARVTAQ